MDKNITVISGDGHWPEVTREAIKVLNAIALKFKHNFNFTHCLMGAVAIDKTCRQHHTTIAGAAHHWLKSRPIQQHTGSGTLPSVFHHLSRDWHAPSSIHEDCASKLQPGIP